MKRVCVYMTTEQYEYLKQFKNKHGLTYAKCFECLFGDEVKKWKKIKRLAIRRQEKMVKRLKDDEKRIQRYKDKRKRHVIQGKKE